jgi:hypothetical protein
MKHFSYFLNPGYRRVSAADDDANVRCSAFLSPDGLRLVVVLINTNAVTPSTMNLSFGTFSVGKSAVYQTAGTNYYFQSLGVLTNSQALPPVSLTTVVLDQNVYVGPATNPSPADGASGVALAAALSWSPGSNALAHAVYLGVDSNAVARAIPGSPLLQGTLSATSFYPPLFGGATYFWRVDEIIGANTNVGPVWSFTTASSPSLLHRYSFSETSGGATADSAGGPAWSGTLPNGGAFSGGQLTLSSGSQQFVSLPAGIASALTNFTVEAWVKLNSTANWTRIFDFGANTTTNMFLTPQNGSTSRVRFAITTSGGGGEQRIDGPSALSAGVWHHVAVTLNASVGTLYVDGMPVGTNSAMTLHPSSLGSTLNNYLGRSQYPADPYLNGALDEFRIYSVALSPPEISATYSMGSNQLLSTNSPNITFTATPANLTLTWPLGSAGFTVQSRTNLVLGSWMIVTSPTPQIVGGQWQVTLPVSADAPLALYRLLK